MVTKSNDETSKAKVADRPHRWTIILSLLAAAISVSSAWFSYQSLTETKDNRQINEDTARAYISVSSLVLDSSLFSPGDSWANRFVKGFVTVANTGRTAAKDVDTTLDLNPPNERPRSHIAQFTDIPPGSALTVRVLLNVGKSLSLTSISDTDEYVVTAELEYDDGFHNDKQTRSEIFCLPRPKKASKTMISLYPCDVHFKLR